MQKKKLKSPPRHKCIGTPFYHFVAGNRTIKNVIAFVSTLVSSKYIQGSLLTPKQRSNLANNAGGRRRGEAEGKIDNGY